jgi:hypothetical protein
MCAHRFISGPWDDDDEMPGDTNGTTNPTVTTNNNSNNNNSSLQSTDFNDTQKHQLRHRELFLTRQIETLLATNIRGKCSVTLHNETESFLSYISAEVRCRMNARHCLRTNVVLVV